MTPFFGDSAREQLQIAQQRRQKFEQAQNAEKASIEEVESALTKAKFSRTLFPYQMQNVQKLTSLPSGATFSVPGAGKTTEALAYYGIKRR